MILRKENIINKVLLLNHCEYKLNVTDLFITISLYITCLMHSISEGNVFIAFHPLTADDFLSRKSRYLHQT